MNLKKGHYNIQGVNPLELCEKFGTPLYVYDFKVMEQKYKRLKKAFSGVKMEALYACKALTNINVLRHFQKMGTGLDTVSIQEVWQGLEAGFEPSKIMYTPNCVSFEEIKMAVETGVQINIDNISILEQFANHYGDEVPICLRINPHISAGGNPKISTGHIDSKFGISVYQMRHVHRVLTSGNVKVNGLHMHTGSDNDYNLSNL